MQHRPRGIWWRRFAAGLVTAIAADERRRDPRATAKETELRAMLRLLDVNCGRPDRPLLNG